MLRTRIAALLAIAAASLPGRSQAQDASTPAPRKRTATYAAPNQAPADSVEVVRAPSPARMIKLIEVNQDGSGFAKDRNYVVGIKSVAVYANRMRWTFYLKNRSRNYYTTWIVGPKSYVADADAETYKPIAMQYPPNSDGYYKLQVGPGTREEFWFDFDLPREETDEFKAMLGVYDLFLAGVPFDAFTVKLAEPVGRATGRAAAPAVPVIVHPEEGPDGADGNPGGGDPAPPRAGGMSPIRPSRSPSRELEKKVDKFRSLSDDGRWVEGNLFVPRTGSHLRIKLAFKRRERNEFVEATLLPLAGPPSNAELHGAFVEDKRSPVGLALVLRDKANAKAEYTLTFDGTTLSGPDPSGNQLTFFVRDKD